MPLLAKRVINILDLEYVLREGLSALPKLFSIGSLRSYDGDGNENVTKQ